MKKQRLENKYNVNVNSLKWETGWNGLYEFAVVGNFCVYHEFECNDYRVTLDNSVYHWFVDLSKYM